MALPRKIRTVLGYIYIKYLGVIPYETKSDKIKLMALGQIYAKNVKMDLAGQRRPRAKSILVEYQLQNAVHTNEKVNLLLVSIAKKGRKEIIALSMEELETLLDEEVMGEMKKK